jgi:hypothetical protein
LDEARHLRTRLYASLTEPDDVRAFDAVAAHAKAAARVADFVRDESGLDQILREALKGTKLH